MVSALIDVFLGFWLAALVVGVVYALMRMMGK